MRKNNELKREAKSLVAPQKGILALIYFLYELMLGAVSCIGMHIVTDPETGALTSIEGGYGSIIGIVVAGPFALSFIFMAIKLFKKEKIEVKDLFKGFGDFVPALLLGVILSIFISLWSLLLVIPGIIMSYAYSMAYYVHIDHPDLQAKECIDKSRKMMKGHKTQLFGLHLSYIGEYLLVIITCGIYSFWLMPKIQMATYLFYRDLKVENGEVEEVVEEQPKEEF